MIIHNPDFEMRRQIAEQIITTENDNPICVIYIRDDGNLGVMCVGDLLDNARMASWTSGALIDLFDTPENVN